MGYRPLPLIFPPDPRRNPDFQKLLDYVQGELSRVSIAGGTGVDAIRLNPLHAAPEKPSPGMLVFAASDWDADGFGTGSGMYYRNETNTAWVFMY
ncbi:MAG: hypothetical protein H7255_14565 [Ramlibacter sp.]|nr:hypothetical protein [Ramlibacter sp.]